MKNIIFLLKKEILYSTHCTADEFNPLDGTPIRKDFYVGEYFQHLKYELTDKTINVDGHVLHRIRALRDFGDVKAGDMGGFVEREKNLSHEGNCWIYDDAKVKGVGVNISGNAEIRGKSYISGNDNMEKDIFISGNTLITDNVKIFGDNINISGGTVFKGSIKVGSNTHIKDYVVIDGNYKIKNANITSHKDLNNYLIENNIISSKENAVNNINEKTDKEFTEKKLTLKPNPIKKSYDDIER